MISRINIIYAVKRFGNTIKYMLAMLKEQAAMGLIEEEYL